MHESIKGRTCGQGFSGTGIRTRGDSTCGRHPPDPRGRGSGARPKHRCACGDLVAPDFPGAPVE
eukprot:467950-Lingulodinium_polyedra.AAC.1